MIQILDLSQGLIADCCFNESIFVRALLDTEDFFIDSSFERVGINISSSSRNPSTRCDQEDA
jgi:hypothetical protein